jgi:hypothetical protein
MPTRGYTDPGTGRASHYDPTLSTAYTGGLWKNCPLLEYGFDPMIGAYLNESFQSYNATSTTGDYLLTQAGAAGSAAISTTYPGCLAIDAGSSTSTQGANVQRIKSAFLPASGKDIWFEARVRMTTTVVSELFIGLAASDTSIIASSAQSTNNRIGWTSVTDDGVLLLDCDKAGTGTTAAATTISTSAWIRLGFKYDGTADTIQQYIDGVATGSPIATTYISKSVMYPSFVCQAAGTGQPVLNIAYRVFQLR